MEQRNPNKLFIAFYGGIEGVTGSNFLLESETEKILVDCGFFQGCDTCDEKNLEPFEYDSSSISYIFVTHAHLDHIGRIPKLVKDGFKGKIISTPPTRDIARLMLEDSLEVLMEESKKKSGRTDEKALPYGKEDIEKTFSLWQTYSYGQKIALGDSLSTTLRDAGHALGSSMIEFRRSGKGLLITGDLGNSPTPLLRDTEIVSDISYLVMETVYGERVHESRSFRKEHLEDIIEEVVKKRGALLIPSFSLERTQELLFEISTMMADNKIPLIPVFLDSPLAIRITDVYRRYKEYFNASAKEIMGNGEAIFGFPQLHMTPKAEDSKIIDRVPNPKIIIAGSGMSNGGRILYHEKKYLPDPASTLLLISYQAPGSLGRQLQEGAKKVRIRDEDVVVAAKVAVIGGYSAHRDSEGLFDFVVSMGDSVRQIFMVMGEPKSSAFFAQRVRDYLGLNAVVPRLKKRYELEM